MTQVSALQRVPECVSSRVLHDENSSKGDHSWDAIKPCPPPTLSIATQAPG